MAPSSLNTWPLLLLLLSSYFFRNISTAKAPAEEVEAVAGSTVRLPCRVRNVDRLLIVLWFRRKDTTPFYSFDARSGNLSGGSGQVHDENLGPRSKLLLRNELSAGGTEPSFNEVPGLSGRIPVFPGWLEISDLDRKDAGAYTCRAEFADSPTQTHHLRLTIYELPDLVLVRDEYQTALRRNKEGSFLAGPIDEGGTLRLTCFARGGWPEPHLEWFWGGHPLPGLIEDLGNGERSSQVELPSMRREDGRKILSCRVSNNPISSPNVSDVIIDMNLRPTAVAILGADTGVDADDSRELLCISRGSFPSANITWAVSDENTWKTLKKSQIVKDDGSTEGRILWVAKPIDNGRKIICIATNPRNENFRIVNETSLVVFHSPIVNLTIGRGLDSNDIKEGIDVYFTCDVTSNPPYDNLEFFRDGIPVKGESSKGLLVIERSLVLRKVSPSASGNYSCRVSNTKGTALSNGVALSVQYKPRCKKLFQILGVTEGKNITVECAIEALPKLVHFSWSVNSSDGLKILTRDKFVIEGQKSILHYQMPTTSRKVELYCLASNGLGEQQDPCVITLVAAGIPERLEHCTLVEQHSRSLRITCVPGRDGLTHQRYEMQVFERGTHHIVANQSSTTPEFTVFGLAPGMDYVIHVFSLNTKGKSPPYILEGFSLKVAENRMDSVDDRNMTGFSTLFALFFGVIATSVILVGALIFAAHLRCKKTPKLRHEPKRLSATDQIIDEPDVDAAATTSALLLISEHPSKGDYCSSACSEQFLEEENFKYSPVRGGEVDLGKYLSDSEVGERVRKQVTYQCDYEGPDEGTTDDDEGPYKERHRGASPFNKDPAGVALCRPSGGILKKRGISSMKEFHNYPATHEEAQKLHVSSHSLLRSDTSLSPSLEPTSFHSRTMLCGSLRYNDSGYTSVGRNSPTSSMSLLLPSSSSTVPFATSLTLGRCQSRGKGSSSCTRRPSESFV